jgi:predicted nucleic acid-binding protein
MAEVFVDSSAWLALADRSERHHESVRITYTDLVHRGHRLVTTELVLAEAHVLLRRRLGHDAALRFLDSTGASPRIDVVFSTSAQHARAVEVLRQYHDQDFSLADAVSFALMTERGIDTALTLDRHFLTAGFVALPAAPTT